MCTLSGKRRLKWRVFIDILPFIVRNNLAGSTRNDESSNPASLKTVSSLSLLPQGRSPTHRSPPISMEYVSSFSFFSECPRTQPFIHCPPECITIWPSWPPFANSQKEIYFSRSSSIGRQPPEDGRKTRNLHLRDGSNLRSPAKNQ